MSLAITAALIGIALAGGIVFLVRRDHLHGGQAVVWLLIAAAALLFGFVPGLVDQLGTAMAVRYPPMALVVIALAALLIKQLLADIELAKKERRIRRLTQKLAILEHEMRHSRPGPAAAVPPSISGERRAVR